MSGLDSIIKVTIDRNTTTPTRAGFGTPCLVGHFPTSVFPDRVRSFGSLGEVGNFFETFDPLYKMASDVFAQNPSPGTIKIGRRANGPSQAVSLGPLDTTEGAVYTVTVTGTDAATYASRIATVDTATYTVGAGETATDICDGLRADFGTQAGDFSDTGTASLVITALNTHATVSGQSFGVVASSNLSMSDFTVDPGIAADLDDINEYDPDWYGLCIDSSAQLEIEPAAAWAEANGKLFVAQTQDTYVASTTNTADTISVADTLEDNSYDRTLLFYHTDNHDYVSAGMLGRALPTTPGSITWAYKTLASVSSQNLTTNEISNLMGTLDTPGGKYVNAYISQSGIGHTRFGTMASGEFADVIRGADWLEARIKEDIFAALVQEDKLPLTDAGINVIKGLILGRLWEGVSNGFLSPDPEPNVTVPRASDLLSADKAARKLTGITFRATLAGAIHYTVIEGELNL